jgi:hypothetical protein
VLGSVESDRTMDFFATAVRLWMEPVQTESWHVLERGLIAVAVSRFSKIRYANGRSDR